MNINNKSNLLRSQRDDLSPYLFHYAGGSDPSKIMESILSEKCLKSQKHNYICFTEAPVTSYIMLLEYMYVKYPKNPMYSYFGIGFSRDILYENYNARNVIYGKVEEKESIPMELRWRFEEMDIEKHDFSWLREWRIEGQEFDFSNFPKDHILIIAPTRKALLDIVGEEDFEIDYSYEHEIRKSIPSVCYKKSRIWKGLAIDEIKNMPNDFIVSGSTTTQNLGEDIRFI